MHGDAADTPCAMDKFSEPYLSVVHALRSARARSRQMDAVVSLNRQASAGKACFALSGEGAMGQFAQGQLDVATAALGVAPVRSVAAARLAPKARISLTHAQLHHPSTCKLQLLLFALLDHLPCRSSSSLQRGISNQKHSRASVMPPLDLKTLPARFGGINSAKVFSTTERA